MKKFHMKMPKFVIKAGFRNDICILTFWNWLTKHSYQVFETWHFLIWKQIRCGPRKQNGSSSLRIWYNFQGYQNQELKFLKSYAVLNVRLVIRNNRSIYVYINCLIIQISNWFWRVIAGAWPSLTNHGLLL